MDVFFVSSETKWNELSNHLLGNNTLTYFFEWEVVVGQIRLRNVTSISAVLGSLTLVKCLSTLLTKSHINNL